MRREVVANASVVEHDALGLAGGAGGIDHIAQLAVAHCDIRVFGLVAEEDIRHVDRLFGRIIGELVGGGDDKGSLGIGDDVIDAVGRILRIARNERRARLVHPEQARKEAALSGQEQRHAVAGLDASCDQIVGDDVCPFVERTVGQRRVLSDQRGLVRVLRRAALKELVQQGLGELGGRLGLEAVEHLLLCFGQPERVAHGLCLRAEQRKSVLQLTDKVLDHRVLKQLGGILHHKMQSLGALADHDADVAAHLLQRRIQLHAQSVAVVGRRIPHEVDAHVKHRVAALVALFHKFADNILKRQISAVGGVAHGGADGTQIVCEGGVALRLDADRRGVDKHADHAVGVGGTHIGGDAQHHILGGGVFAEHHGNGGEDQLKFRHAETARGVVDRFELLVIVIKGDLSVGKRMHLGALALDRHLIDGNAVGKQLAVERHTALVFFIQAVVIQIGQVDGSGGHFFAVQAVDQLLHKGLGGAAVKGDVMNGKMEDHAAVRDRIEGRTNRDCRVEVERLGVAVDDGDDLFARCGCFFGDLGQLIGEDAHRQAVFFSIVGGERLVRPENCIKRFFDGFDIGALDDGGDIEIVNR